MISMKWTDTRAMGTSWWCVELWISSDTLFSRNCAGHARIETGAYHRSHVSPDHALDGIVIFDFSSIVVRATNHISCDKAASTESAMATVNGV